MNDPFPACALRAVLDHDAFRGERVADAVAGGEIAALARLGAFCEQVFDPRDIDAVRGALEPGFRIDLQQADARNHRVAGLSLVLTNPPMGRRVLRARGLSGVLCQVVRNVAGQLVPGGRMVWLSPFADATARAASDAGLRVERLSPVDLGGFNAELQRFSR